jgi:putative nucleotidyltransferase with HDIG domain
MPDKGANVSVSVQQTAIAFAGLESLSSTSAITAQLLPKLSQEHFQPSSIINIIEADPALACLAMSILARNGINLPDGRFSLGNALDKLPSEEVRNAFLSITNVPTVEQGDNKDNHNRTGLMLHSLAVACCSKAIAEKASPRMDPQLAYYAGLLHDIGKFATEEVMPKSFEILSSQAQSQQQSFLSVEQANLGLDHTIIGKHLSQKWLLPNLVTLAIWLHHSQTLVISRELPEARIAVLVQLADSLTRQLNIGWSGSCDNPPQSLPLAEALAIEDEQLEKIKQNLRPAVAEKTKALALDIPKAQQRYCTAMHNLATSFVRKSTSAAEELRSCRSASSHLDFVKNFLLKTNSAMPAINIAETLAVHWQKFYQTGKVCLYLSPSTGTQNIDAVIVQSLSQSKIVCLAAPAEQAIIPKDIGNNFAILNAYENIDWLFEQLDVNFDASQTRLVPLLCAGRTVGAIAFEIHYPCDTESHLESFRISVSIAGTVLALAMESDKEQRYSEQLVQLVSAPQERVTIDEAGGTVYESSIIHPQSSAVRHPIADIDNLEALAEMAAGAAHELNNPLAVIVGRAQLLAEAENNQQKKQELEQIYENANKASEIIEDLMSFAQPNSPHPVVTEIAQLVEEAVELATLKTKAESLDVQTQLPADIEKVFVDSAQTASGLANIITNAVESYQEKTGPVNIAAAFDATTNMVKLTVSDKGCGMDEQTLRKATWPFFSARPAGRKLGMGLAWAARLIQINKGMLSIESEPGTGTTVNIYLPLK